MSPFLPTAPLPLVGRTVEVAELRDTMDAVARSRGQTWLLTGEGGVGKTRLAAVAREEAERRNWHVVYGRAFAVESGVPYALVADALVPVVRRFDADSLAVLTRGVDELTFLFPWLAPDGARPARPVAADFRSRLHWHFTQFLRGLVERNPLLVVLEDLQWADTSSLELLHFVARQMTDAPLFLLCTCNPQAMQSASGLRSLRQSITSTAVAREVQLAPLGEDAVGELLHRAFGGDHRLTGEFASVLYRWTRGNPFFLEETLKALIASGDLREEDGRWTGWQIDVLRLPASVREAVLTRLEVLSAAAREAADTAAVLGSRFSFDMLADAVQLTPDALLAAIDELRRVNVLAEIATDDDVEYDFVHPLIRETLYGDLGRVRVRLVHGTVAISLERRYGASAIEHAGELAYHFARARAVEAEEKAVRYLYRAGQEALAKHADREAADYLSAALERMRSAQADPAALIDAMEGLARAQQRLGDYAAATALWKRVQQWAIEHGEPARAAAMARRMGLACYWTGNLGEALGHIDTGLGYAAGDDAVAVRVRLHTARAACLQELGRADEALREVELALAAANAMVAAGAGPASADLLIRVHRTFLQLHLWSGNAQLAREHGNRALDLVTGSADGSLTFVVHWAMGIMEAFSGNSDAVQHHLAETMRLAEELRSPVLRAWSAELALEVASASGDWDSGLALGEEAIRLARALQQQILLPRLLVWTGLIYLGRADIERGESLIDEAWQLSGADRPGTRGVNVHMVMPAYIGRASVQLARGDHKAAVRIGEEALELADRMGYVLWGVHRVMPIIAESYLWMRDLEGATRIGRRLRRDAERLGHGLGIAWAQACEALVAWLGGDSERGAVMLREAAERLEAVPFMPDATRLRRQLAGRLAEIGDRDGALRELRIVHDRLLALGAEPELRKARQQFRELGSRPPPLGVTREPGPLTAREADVAALVAKQRSSKAIARELGISVRTVDAHLTNIYRKLEIGGRGELAELMRSGQLD